MCSPVTCEVCGKTTWSGCGQHIASVKARVPADQWCDGEHTQAEILAARKTGFLGRIRGAK
nr:hypothetical protein [Changpingibacter yushuensis]